MIAGRVFVTPHAVRRYMERHRPGLSYEEALGELIHAAEDAHLVKAANGCAILRTGRAYGRIRLVVGPGDGPLPAVLTVLPGRTSKGRRKC